MNVATDSEKLGDCLLRLLPGNGGVVTTTMSKDAKAGKEQDGNQESKLRGRMNQLCLHLRDSLA